MTGPRLAQSPLYQFFVANPDEELTIEDVAAKFGVGRRAAGMLIYRLQRHGVLEYVRVARLPARGMAKVIINLGGELNGN